MSVLLFRLFIKLMVKIGDEFYEELMRLKG